MSPSLEEALEEMADTLIVFGSAVNCVYQRGTGAAVEWMLDSVSARKKNSFFPGAFNPTLSPTFVCFIIHFHLKDLLT